MKIAFISDVHGVPSTLEAALGEAGKLGYDRRLGPERVVIWMNRFLFSVIAIVAVSIAKPVLAADTIRTATDDRFAKMRDHLAQEARAIFDCCQKERDIFFQQDPLRNTSSAKALRDLRRSEESARLDRLLKRIDESFDVRIGPKRKIVPEVQGRSPEGGNSHGGDDAHLEFLRRERELIEEHHRMQMSEQVIRMLREDVRNYERWLRERVAEDRHQPFRSRVSTSVSRPKSSSVARPVRPRRPTVPPEVIAMRERGRPAPPTEDIRDWFRNYGWFLLLCIAPLGGLALVAFCRKIGWFMNLLRRQNDFYRRYEAGIVNRPLGPDVCWFCGERGSGPAEGSLAEHGVGVCGDCRHAQAVIQSWIFCIGFLAAAVTFCVSAYRIYWTVWCDGRVFVACLLGGVVALVAFVFVFLALAFPLARVAHYRLGCRKNLAYELKAAKREVARRVEQEQRGDRVKA